ncbi:hypothetical protein Tco_0664028 [Tanacetum coccineum]
MEMCTPWSLVNANSILNTLVTNYKEHVTQSTAPDNSNCPTTEIQKMEQELWTLSLKGDDIETYNNRFHELALMCPELVPTERKKTEKYIRGFLKRIKGNITSSKPTTLHEAVNMARELAEQAVQGKATRMGERNKRKWEEHQNQNRRDLPMDIPLDSVVVLRYEKRSKSENKGKVPTEMELVLEQTQQGTSYEVSEDEAKEEGSVGSSAIEYKNHEMIVEAEEEVESKEGFKKEIEEEEEDNPEHFDTFPTMKELRKFFKENEKKIFSEAGDGVRIYPYSVVIFDEKKLGSS